MNKYCVIGEKLAHTLSPCIHEAYFAETGVVGSYDVVEIPGDKLATARALLCDYDGVNVTVPYKSAVIPLMDELSEDAAAMGAVNTVKNRDGVLIGYNTDAYGFCAMLARAGFDVRGKSAVVLGSGGASKAVCNYFLRSGAASVTVVSRHADGGIANGCPSISYAEAESIGGDVLVNATPVGMFPHDAVSPISQSAIARFGLAVDLIYNPLFTDFLKFGAAAGTSVCGGLYMLVAQAIKAQSVWTGRPCEDKLCERIYRNVKSQFALNCGGNIYLMGTMGCGKSCVGKILAERLGREFVDVDVAVETETGQSVEQLFEKGEAHFRTAERAALLNIVPTKGKIVALGGGVPLNPRNREVLELSGTCVWLDRNPMLITATADLSNRPLLKDGNDKFYDVCATRRPIYEASADVTVVNDGDAKTCADKIIEVLKL